MPDIPVRVDISVSESVQHYSVGVATSPHEVPIEVDSTTNAVTIGVSESTHQVPIEVAEAPSAVQIGVGTAIVASGVVDYDGQTEFIATSETQVFPTSGKRLLHDIIIDPIPHNYGLITYNGSYITVS